MKLVVISTIRNESDILEIFVRYHLQIVDHMIIINHRSADSSLDILRRIEQEGLPVTIADVKDLEHQQGMVLTQYLKKAVRDYNADWVIPLDADEFLAVSGKGSAREVMEKLPQDKVVKVLWRTYVPLPSDNYQEPNILKRITHCRRTENQNLRKIMIPRTMAMKKNGFISAGNHGFVREIFRKQKEFPYIHTNNLVFAHFPVRSSQQIMAKAFVGWLACLSKPNKEPTEAFHLKVLYDRFKNGGQISPEELTSMAFEYATTSGASALALNDISHKPLVPQKGDLTLLYTNALTNNPLAILAQMAEEFAEALGTVRRKGLKEINNNRFRSWKRFWQKK
jgi:hypothetical protein